jgi:hypothetical protein
MERVLADASILKNLSFPTVIDVTDGESTGLFSISLLPGALSGAHVLMTFDYIAFSFDIGESGESVNTFTDSTPDYASSSYIFFGGYPAGDYKIRTLYVWDDTGNGASYTAADLQAMKLPSMFTVIDHNAPAAPTIGVDATAAGLIQGKQAVLSGQAGADQDVTVTYLSESGFSGVLGTTRTDAQGHWSLTTGELYEGHYTQVVATTESASGNVSTYSAPLSFYVQNPPVATAVYISHGTDGVVNAAAPLIWGTTDANARVTVYDGGKAIATVQAGMDGWWGAQPGKLASGTHQLTAVVEDQFGRQSPASAAADVRVGAVAAGISYTVGSFSNESTQALDVKKLQAVLDAVAALTSGVIDGTQNIVLSVAVKNLGDERVIASAGSHFHSPGSDGAMPLLTDARLNLSPDFAQAINDAQSLDTYAITVLAHEMLHVLGFQSDPGSKFQALTRVVGGDAYFYGASARGINSGDVLLSSDHAHVAEMTDLIAPAHLGFWPYFTSENAGSPYSALDLAILKDLGYQNKDAIVSEDGHRYLAGNGQAGHNTVTGVAGIDTLYIHAKTTEYAVKATATGYTAADKSGADGTLQLTNIERIYFDDKAMVLDVGIGQTGGEVYRMYQAAFNRAPDSPGLGFWIGKIDYSGWSLQSVARAFQGSDEFIRLYGNNLGDSDYVTQLYANVLHRQPEQAGLEHWMGKIHGGMAREDVLISFSESAENIANLVGTLKDGFTYTYAGA